MQEFDFFELTGLAFDEPEKNVKKVSNAIGKKINELNSLLGIASQNIEREEINSKLLILEKARIELLTKDDSTKDDKLTEAFFNLAKEKSKQETENLSAIVELLWESGSRIATEGTIRTYCQKSKLSKKKVEEVFIKKGFEISDYNPLKALPKFPTNIDKITAELDALRRIKISNTDVNDLVRITDLYTLIAFLEGEIDNSIEYRSTATNQLEQLFDGQAKKYSTRNDPLGKHYASLAAMSKKYVFNNEENRMQYELYLKYLSPSLTQMFASMKRVSKQSLMDPGFAEKCIKQISKVFGDYDVALAIYNKEAELKDDPYIPEKPVFHVKCHYCDNIVQFTTIDEAQNINKCSHCGESLYKKCKKCSKGVLKVLDKCPDCGYLFFNAATFQKYYSSAESALRSCDFESARSYILKAHSADPSEKPKLDALSLQVDKKEREFEKPISVMRELIANKKYQKASLEMATIIEKYPSLDIAIYTKQIDSVLTKARTDFSKADKLTSSKKADECLNILDYCFDFKPAYDYLYATVPEKCKAIQIGLDGLNSVANISWIRSTERGITYRLVRKQGKDIPMNEVDGEVLVDKLVDSSYRDYSLLPGEWYSYAIFAIRYGVFSQAEGKSVVLLADVSNFKTEQTINCIRITWDEPKNNIGVEIHRYYDGIKKVLTTSAHGSYEDKDIDYGVSYTYKIIVNYTNSLTSNGISTVVTPLPMIGLFSINYSQISESYYKVSWDIKHAGIDLRLLVNDKQVKHMKSEQGSCEIELSSNNIYMISVLAFSGGVWKKSENSIQINTFTMYGIDKKKSYITEKEIIGLKQSTFNIELNLIVDNLIGDNVVGFYYSVRTKKSQNRWPKTQDVNIDADIHRINIKTYLKNGKIIFNDTAQDESSYYISIFTIYHFNGKEIISNPKPCRFERPLNANLFWKVTKNIMGLLKLYIELDGNRPITRVPELILCACDENQHLVNHNDIRAKSLLKIPAVFLDLPSKNYQNSFEISIMPKQLKDMKLFLFEIEALENEKFTLRWSNGFLGKV